jgi:hypothetical protein
VNVKNNVKAVPRVVVGGYLKGLRLPLVAAERVSGQRGNETWPPTLAFEGFEANVETVVGGLLHDDTLVDRGRLRQAKLAQLRKAVELETVAEQERARADRELAERQRRADAKREQAEQTAAQREQQVERAAEQRERQVQQQAARKTTAARQVKAQQDKAIRGQERTAKLEALSKETEALDATKDALDAQATIDVIDETIEGTKAARKTS